ncbi:minor tail protein [Mycobacterium phage MyraDee]|uniref:Minor tail protein n=1 Tax=Mycobacterium phage MyraDee TaxID=2024303 RepID=A0A222YZL7_9CAUD|nr:minor tail protein [Mycobacterium phage MyraDee]ASR77137.1 minor tail protein [Mycobacterium phage MyraDee]
MTAPNQPMPTSLATMLGVGAFQIGGGGTSFGQDINESFVNALVKVPLATLDTMFDILRDVLLKLPLEALEAFKSLIPEWISQPITDVGQAVEHILAALDPRKIPLNLADFQVWVSTTFNTVSVELRQIMEILGGLIVTPINGAVQAVKDWWNQITGKTSKLQNNGTVPQTAVGGFGGSNDLADGLGQLLDSAVKGAGNLLGSGFGFGDLFDTLRGMQANIADANAALAQLQAEQNGNQNSGKRLLVNVGDWNNSSDVPSVFTNVISSGSGSVATVDGQLTWLDSGGNSAQRFYLFNADELLSDYFEVAFVMPRRSEDEGPFGIFSPSYDYAIGRSNAAASRFCFARVGYGRARMGCVVDGNTTLFGPGDIFYSAPAGSLVKFRGGTAGGVRVFQLQINSQIIGTVTDTGAVSHYGQDYRKVGLGFEATARAGGQGTPGTMSVFAANDNTPNETRGVGFRAFRASASSISKSGATGQITALPANCLDTVDRITPDMQWDAATQTLTIGVDGWYMFPMRVESGGIQPADRFWGTGVIKNNVLAARGEGWTSQNGGNNAQPPQNTTMGGGSMPLYCVAGDKIRPACDLTAAGALGSTNAGTLIGDASGSKTWFAAIMINRSLA